MLSPKGFDWDVGRNFWRNPTSHSGISQWMRKKRLCQNFGGLHYIYIHQYILIYIYWYIYIYVIYIYKYIYTCNIYIYILIYINKMPMHAWCNPRRLCMDVCCHWYIIYVSQIYIYIYIYISFIWMTRWSCVIIQYARYLFDKKHRHRMTKNIVQPKALKFFLPVKTQVVNQLGK